MPESPHRLLVVSDDRAFTTRAERAFPAGTTVVTADDASTAWNLLVDGSTDLVIVDLQIGNAGGFAFAREMSFDARFRNIPILMVLDRDQDAWLAKAAGASATVTRPIDAARLVARSRALVS